MYWLRMNKDIEYLCKSCKHCQELQPKQPREPMHMHERPATPWTKVGTDLFTANGQDYLIISVYFSRYPVNKRLHHTSAKTIIAVTKEVFSMFGILREVVSNNGAQFLTLYNQFCSEGGIQHVTSSPRHPQSNGFIERQIRYIKPIVKKCQRSGGGIDLALVNVRATPIGGVIPSPGRLYGTHTAGFSSSAIGKATLVDTSVHAS